MSYIYDILRDNPYAVWPLDASGASLSDVGPNAKNATATGSPTVSRPITAKGVAALYITSAQSISYPVSNILTSGKELRPFTLEMWIRPENLSASGWLIKRNNGGVKLNGPHLSFVLPMNTTLTADYYGIRAGRNYHICCVYDTQGLYLYVNGELQDSETVSAADLTHGFSSEVATNLSTSFSAGCEVIIDSPAIYTYPMTKESVLRHYSRGTDYPPVELVSRGSNSNLFPFYDDRASVAYTLEADSDIVWNSGVFTGQVASVSDILQNSYDATADTWSAGTWTGSLRIPAQSLTFPGSRISWESNKDVDFTVQVSTDDSTWTTVTNFSEPFASVDATNGADLFVRVNFSASTTQTTLSELKLVVFSDKSVLGVNSNVTATVSGPAILADSDYLAATFDDRMGINLTGSMSLVEIGPDSYRGDYQAVEMLVKISSSDTQKAIFGAGTTSTIKSDTNGKWVATDITAIYIDGVSQDVANPITVSTSVWHHVIIVFPSYSGTLFIGNDLSKKIGYEMRVGYLAVYFVSVTFTLVTSLYDNLVGSAVSRITESGSVAVAESNFSETGVAARGYTHDWTLVTT